MKLKRFSFIINSAKKNILGEVNNNNIVIHLPFRANFAMIRFLKS